MTFALYGLHQVRPLSALLSYQICDCAALQGVCRPQGGSVVSGLLTQQGRVAVPQREALVAGDVERRQEVKFPLKERLQAGRRRVGWVEQVVDLLAGGTQLRHCEIKINT